MITIKRYCPSESHVWDKFVESSKNGIFMFERGFMDYHSDRFNDYSLMFYNDDELIAILPASIKSEMLFSHGGLTYGGFIVNVRMKQHLMNECCEELIKHLEENNFKGFVYKAVPYIYHKYPSEEDLYSLWRSGFIIRRRDVSSVIDLSKTIKLQKGRKAQISRAKREGVVVEESDMFDEFIELENSVLLKYHNVKAAHTGKELRLLKSRFPENIKLYIARKNCKIVSGVLVFIYEKAVHTQYMASSECGRELGGLDLIIYSIMEEFRMSKKYLDFGISTESDGLYLNLGLTSQKEGFGGRTIVYDTYEFKLYGSK